MKKRIKITVYDYSDENIIYNFKANGILVVSGGDNTGYTNGEYEYFFWGRPFGW